MHDLRNPDYAHLEARDGVTGFAWEKKHLPDVILMRPLSSRLGVPALRLRDPAGARRHLERECRLRVDRSTADLLPRDGAADDGLAGPLALA